MPADPAPPVAVLLLVAATVVALLPGPRPAVRRLRRLLGPPPGRAGGTDGAAGARRLAVSVLAGVTTLVVLGPAGGAVAPVVGVGAWVVLGRLEPARRRRLREAVLRDLPAAADLLVACLGTGAPTADAVRAVGEALDGPLGRAWRRAATAAAWGAPWREVAATWRHDPVLAPLAAVGDVLAAAEDDGLALVPAVREVAAVLRTGRTHRAAAAARRAGVRAAAPLGLCFLPAFVLVGLVPLVVALAG